MNTYLQTGQITCHDADGRMIDCTGSGQDMPEIRNWKWGNGK